MAFFKRPKVYSLLPLLEDKWNTWNSAEHIILIWTDMCGKGKRSSVVRLRLTCTHDEWGLQRPCWIIKGRLVCILLHHVTTLRHTLYTCKLSIY